MTPAEWMAIVANVVVSAGLTILVGYGVRYVVRGLAGAHRAAFGAFCFMLGAVLVQHDTEARSTEDVCRFAGGVVALFVLYRLWLSGKNPAAQG